eukprot:snap_masked-scaffold_3-processed-gene-10.24-mRNA-1 protein AED:1.00 eAED:1.00 QI:0/0/0/0/1/1/2/0/180
MEKKKEKKTIRYSNGASYCGTVLRSGLKCLENIDGSLEKPFEQGELVNKKWEFSYEGKFNSMGEFHGSGDLLEYKGGFKRGELHGFGSLREPGGNLREVLYRKNRIIGDPSSFINKMIRIKVGNVWRTALVEKREESNPKKFLLNFCDFCFNQHKKKKSVFLDLEEFEVYSNFTLQAIDI